MIAEPREWALILFRNQQPQIAQVVAGRPSDNRVAEGGEHGTGVEGSQRRLQMESERVGASHGRGVSDSPCGLGVAIDAVRSGAEYRQPCAWMALKLQCACHHKLLVASSGTGRPVQSHRDLAD